MTVLAIDPGPVESAYVLLGDQGAILNHGKIGNEEMLDLLGDSVSVYSDRLAVEMIASYGMPVGAEVFETCVWIGRFIQRYDRKHHTYRLTRNVVKNHLCHSSKAKDSNIRQAIIDRFGGKEKAIGKKAAPGPLYGISADEWAALAVGLTFWDTREVR